MSMSLTRNELIQSLQSTPAYDGQTKNDIDKQLRSKYRLKTVKKEDYVRELSSLQSNKTSKKSTNQESTTILPNELMLETLFVSDIDTIVNTCTSSKKMMTLCGESFWRAKFKHDHLPILKQPASFQGWVKLYEWTTTMNNRPQSSHKVANITVLFDELKKHGFKYQYKMGIQVYMNKHQYVDISRQDNFELALDVYTNNKKDPYSLFILEDHGMINMESLIPVLNLVKNNLALFK